VCVSWIPLAFDAARRIANAPVERLLVNRRKDIFYEILGSVTVMVSRRVDAVLRP
jgi:hypothetical protein